MIMSRVLSWEDYPELSGWAKCHHGALPNVKRGAESWRCEWLSPLRCGAKEAGGLLRLEKMSKCSSSSTFYRGAALPTP